MKREFSAGGAVFKKDKERILWLLVQPKGGDEFHKQTRWQLPKGWLDEGEKSEEAAKREVEEEGGVKAEIIRKIDTIKIFFKNTFEGKPEETVIKTITFFLMEYEAPAGLHPGYLLPTLRRERNPSEAGNSSRSSTSLRSRFSAKGDKSDSLSGFGEETEQIIWLPFEEAKEKLTFKSEKQILEKAQEILEASKAQPTLF